MSQPIKPPFTEASARAKVQAAEDLWNTCDPDRVVLAYTEDTAWRNRGEFATGRDAVRDLLARKWQRELGYRLKKELFTFSGNRIAVHFEYEYRDDSGQHYRAYGNEHWVFAEDGRMQQREASINEITITEDQRRID
ncbi:MAG: nuclear transport factor 2 family protein [Halieaceae bacterium]|jgi:nuclear transport factor 2 (NTF2) superfamily protein|nr:nuclear transport factor 2 family protein [Halieaceae bacterium]